MFNHSSGRMMCKRNALDFGHAANPGNRIIRYIRYGTQKMPAPKVSRFGLAVSLLEEVLAGEAGLIVCGAC